MSICVAEHFEDGSQMSQSHVDEKTGKIVCRQHTDGDLTKEDKDENRIRILRGDVYIMKSSGPSTERWGTPHKQAHEEEK